MDFWWEMPPAGAQIIMGVGMPACARTKNAPHHFDLRYIRPFIATASGSITVVAPDVYVLAKRSRVTVSFSAEFTCWIMPAVTAGLRWRFGFGVMIAVQVLRHRRLFGRQARHGREAERRWLATSTYFYHRRHQWWNHEIFVVVLRGAAIFESSVGTMSCKVWCQGDITAFRPEFG